VLDAMIDVPFAMPTAVAGLALGHLYSPDGWFGRLGFVLTGSPGGIVAALVFVGLPFVVRTVQPVIKELDLQVEQAAASLGAGRLAIFRRVIFPALAPAWLAGCGLAMARAIGEYGSVIFIAGNIPGRSQIAPLQIMARLDEHRTEEAAAIGLVLLVASLALLGLVGWVERRLRPPEAA